MKIEIEFFNDKFSDINSINWPCPSCKRGHVSLKQKNIKAFETKQSLKSRESDTWAPEWIERNFIGTMVCLNSQCKEIFTVAGKIQNEEIYGAKKEPYYTEYLYIQYVFPVIHFFPLPDNLPFEVLESLEESFKLFWLNKSACANAIRTSIELILTDKKVPKTSVTKNGKRRILSLHERIELFKAKNSLLAHQLMAVKWIGNAGSHTEPIYTEHLHDGFDLLKYSIDKLYSDYDKQIDQLSKQINKKKKPLS